MKIISCKRSLNISRKISNSLNADIVLVKKQIFTGKEFAIKIEEEINDEEVIIIFSIAHFVNDELMSLLLAINAAKNNGAQKIHIIIPYMPYSRQDKIYTNQSHAISIIANILNNSGIDNLITIDIHNKESLKLFAIPITNIDPIKVISTNKTIIIPDKGGEKRCGFKNYISLNKNRTEEISFSLENQEISGLECIIIDDIIDSGKTLSNAANFLIANGAKSVEAFVTHALFSKDSINRINDSNISHLTITNTIPYRKLPKNTEVLDISNIIIEKIKSLKH